MRKKPWELHALVCLHLLVFGVAVSGEWFGSFNENQGLILGAMAISLFGLFRGNRFVWWITICVFSVLSIVTVWADVSLLSEHGFRAHWLFRNAHTLVLLCVGTLGLLLSCLFREAMPPPSASLFEETPALRRLAAVITTVLFLGASLGSLLIVTLNHIRRQASDISHGSSMKTITSAEADFRANDRDGNDRNDFWTGDVQGLYGLIPKGGTKPIKLIELSLARSDGDPLQGYYPAIPESPGQTRGAWCAALLEDRSVTPPLRYRSPKEPFQQACFGFIIYPDDYISGGRRVFAINESNTIFRRDLKGDIKGSDRLPPGPVRDPEFLGFPSDDDLKAKWSKLD